MKGEDPAAVLVGQGGADTLAHLPCRLVGKGDGKDVFGGYAQHFGKVYTSVSRTACACRSLSFSKIFSSIPMVSSFCELLFVIFPSIITAEGGKSKSFFLIFARKK